MEKNYPILGKLAIALILAFLAVYLPFIPVKIVFIGAAGILFALCFKKFKVLLIIFFILMLLIMGAVYASIEFFSDFEFPWFMNHMGQMNFGVEFEQNNRMVLPDTDVAVMGNLVVLGNALRVDFVKDIQMVQYPSEMIEKVSDERNELTLDGRSIRGNRTLVVQVPADYSYEKISMDVDAASISGNAITQVFDIHADAVNFQGSYEVDRLKVDAEAMNFKGVLDGKDFTFNAEAMNFTADVKQLEYFEIDSEVLNGKLKFLSGWESKRQVELKATFGKFVVQTPRNQPSELSVNHKGELFNVDVEEY
ncbi:MAG TPA: hypothetical protein P5107_08460 [Thermotogota bacterium]|nr:hypothetical protein [Thermotogota bacterium]